MHPSGKARINGTSIFLPNAPIDNDNNKEIRHLLAGAANLATLPPERRDWPTALLWQTTSGPRAAPPLVLLDEVCNGPTEPMPHDFLATAAQLKPFLPGLQAASCQPLATKTTARWPLLLSLAHHWLSAGRYAP